MILTTKDKLKLASTKYECVINSNNIKFNKLDDWLLKESDIFLKETVKPKNKTYHQFRRGQIIKIDFGINIGSELSYTHYAIVLNNYDNIMNDSLLVVPITSKNGCNRVHLGKLLLLAHPNTKKYNLNCYANMTQIKTISKSRIFNDNKTFICSSDILDNIDIMMKDLFTKPI